MLSMKTLSFSFQFALKNRKLVIKMGRIERIFALIFIIVAFYIQTIGITLISSDLLVAILFYLISIIVGISLLLNGIYFLANRIIITDEKISNKIMNKTIKEVKWKDILSLEFKFTRGSKSSYHFIFNYVNKYGIEENLKINLGTKVFYEKSLQNLSRKLVTVIEEITDKGVEIIQTSSLNEKTSILFSKWKWNLIK